MYGKSPDRAASASSSAFIESSSTVPAGAPSTSSIWVRVRPCAPLRVMASASSMLNGEKTTLPSPVARRR